MQAAKAKPAPRQSRQSEESETATTATASETLACDSPDQIIPADAASTEHGDAQPSTAFPASAQPGPQEAAASAAAGTAERADKHVEEHAAASSSAHRPAMGPTASVHIEHVSQPGVAGTLPRRMLLERHGTIRLCQK